MSGDTRPVQGQLKDTDGNPYQGWISFTPKDIAPAGTTVVDPQRTYTEELDEAGTFLTEPALPTNWTYDVSTTLIGKHGITHVPVADFLLPVGTTAVELADLVTAPPGAQIVAGRNGRGIDGITVDGDTATVHYDDGSTSTFALPPGTGTGVTFGFGPPPESGPVGQAWVDLTTPDWLMYVVRG